MPGRGTKITSLAVAAAFAIGGLLLAGCADAEHHTWQGEFTGRLEGSVEAIEGASGELRPSSSEKQVFQASMELSRKLEFRSKAIEVLDPPAACEAVQETGAKKLSGLALDAYNFYKNLTPYLHRHLPRILKEDIAAIDKIEREAEGCE